MHGPTILDDSQSSCRDLLNDAMVERNHAVGHIVLQAMSRGCTLASLGRNDRRRSQILASAEEPPKFGTQDQFIRQRGEQGCDRIQYDPLRLDAIDGVTKTDEESFQIVLAGLLDLALFRSDEIIRQEIPLLERRKVETRGRRRSGPILPHSLRTT